VLDIIMAFFSLFCEEVFSRPFFLGLLRTIYIYIYIYVYIYGVCTVFLESPNVRSYTVYIYEFGQPCFFLHS